MPANFENIFPLVGSIDGVDAKVLELEHVFIEAIHVASTTVGNEARGKLYNFVQIVSVELAFQIGEAVVNLNGTLAVSDVENLLDACLVFDHTNVSRGVVKAHLGEGEHPVVIVSGRVILGVSSRVLTATVVTDPHIIAIVHKLQMERLTCLEGRKPVSTILIAAMLNKHGAFRVSLRGFAGLAEDAERGQDIVIVGLDLVCLPIVTPLVHDVLKTRILSRQVAAKLARMRQLSHFLGKVKHI